MVFLLQISVLIFILITLLSVVKQIRKRKKQPPGPLGLPFVGEKPFRILQLFFPSFFSAKSENQYFSDMKKKYGDIWSVDLGDKIIIVFASMNVMVEAMHDNAKLFSGRPISEALKIICENRGIAFSNGDVTQANRQLGFKALKELGVGTKHLENLICEVVNDLIKNLEQNLSKSTTSPNLFVKPISNITYQLIFNKRSKNDDLDFENFIKNINILFHSNETNDIIEFFVNILPRKYVRKLFPQVDTFLKSTIESMRFIEQQCRSRIEVESEYTTPSCIFDYFWRYRYQDDPRITFDEKLHDISHSMFDIFFAGIDTSSIILSFSCLFLGQYRDVQEDIRNELKSIVDDHKHINMEMRKKCPKLLSFMDEIHRFCILCPRFIRRTTSNCMFRNYEIQSNDIILGDQVSGLRDPTLFENPDEFDANRFLDKSRTKYLPNKYLIPFGKGKRSCLGENLAEKQLFLFLSKIIVQFDISLPKETQDRINEIIEGYQGLLHGPGDHEIILKKNLDN